MNAKDFIRIWEEFIFEISKKEDVFSKYQDDSEWTKLVLGENRGNSSISSTLGNFIRQKSCLEYRTEDSKIDIAFGNKNDNFSGIKSYNKNESVINESNFYPKDYPLLIEHENKIEYCWQEMMKLTYLRAKLKVLITYNWFKDDGKRIDLIKDNFGKIIEQANSDIQEDIQTEYLLIVGHCIKDEIHWHNFIFNFNETHHVIAQNSTKWIYSKENSRKR